MLVRKQTTTDRYKEEGKRRNILKATKKYLKYCEEEDSSLPGDPKWQWIHEDASPAMSFRIPLIDSRQFHPKQDWEVERNSGQISSG